MKPWPALAVVLLVTTATTSVLLRADIAVNPAAAAPPVTLASGTSGTPVLGQSLTSADVTTALGVGQISVTALHGGSQDWKVRLELVQVTGAGALDSFTIAACQAGCNDQIKVSGGSVTQSTGTARTIPAGTTDGSVGVSGTKVSLADTVFTAQIVLIPATASTPEVRYDYTLRIKAL